jgi:[ribosomal protein S5]-alanine N-acetyltransferase
MRGAGDQLSIGERIAFYRRRRRGLSQAVLADLVSRTEDELGYIFHRDVWSQGYATEAAGLLLLFGFNRLRLRRIAATCHPDNIASARVLEKIGMQREARLRSHLFVRGAWRDSLLYAAVEEDS